MYFALHSGPDKSFLCVVSSSEARPPSSMMGVDLNLDRGFSKPVI